MYSKPTYSDLWNRTFVKIKGLKIPDYCDFLDREHMLEDYLDIFRGLNTRDARTIKPCQGWYYDHPFFDNSGNPLVNRTKIKYFLIAEACPQNGANYFYDLRELKKQGYLCSAFKASYYGIGPSTTWTPLKSSHDKATRLLDLAKRGVVLLDIFPFAINYGLPKGENSLRNKLTTIYSSITDSFWNDMGNPYCLQKRINRLSALLNPEWDLCVIAPPLLSLYILNNLPNLVVFPGGNHPMFFKDKATPSNRSKGSDYKKFAVNTSNINPDYKLITSAFI